MIVNPFFFIKLKLHFVQNKRIWIVLNNNKISLINNIIIHI